MTIIRTIIVAFAVVSGVSAVSAMPAEKGGAKMFFDQLTRSGS